MTSVYRFLSRRAGENQLEKTTVKILDFGLARLAGKAGALASRAGSPEPGLCGTPDFMAPELGRDSTTVDIRCDLYSLGCTFSFLLTGQVPYPGGSWSEKLIRHHYDPATPIWHMRPDVPCEIAELVGRLMAKDPGDRFATPGEVALAIQDWQEAEMLAEKAATSSSPSRSSKLIDLSMLHAADSPPIPESMETISQAKRRPSRARFAWPLTAGFAIAAGLGLAWVVSTPVFEKTVGAVKAWATPAEYPSGFRVSGKDLRFARLDQAIAHAQDGDTILVRGNGPFLIHGVSCRGKSLTIKAETGFRPRFDFLAAPRKSDWTPLFWANRDLTLHGIELNDPGEKASLQGDVSHGMSNSPENPRLKITGRKGRGLIGPARRPRLKSKARWSRQGSLLASSAWRNSRISLGTARFSPRSDAPPRCSGPATTHTRRDELKNELVGARLFALNGLMGRFDSVLAQFVTVPSISAFLDSIGSILAACPVGSLERGQQSIWFEQELGHQHRTNGAHSQFAGMEELLEIHRDRIRGVQICSPAGRSSPRPLKRPWAQGFITASLPARSIILISQPGPLAST